MDQKRSTQPEMKKKSNIIQGSTAVFLLGSILIGVGIYEITEARSIGYLSILGGTILLIPTTFLIFTHYKMKRILQDGSNQILFNNGHITILSQGIKLNLLKYLSMEYIEFNRIICIYILQGIYKRPDNKVTLLFHYISKNRSLNRKINGKMGNVFSFDVKERELKKIIGILKNNSSVKIRNMDKRIVFEPF